MTWRSMLLPLALGVLAVSGCKSHDEGSQGNTAARMLAVTIRSQSGSHVFNVARAVTAAEQEQGLMYKADIPDDGGMLFWPYPPSGGPKVASFWMKNTPSPLDIVFIRPNGTIARIAENTVPFSEEPVSSGEPVSAVLEIRGGRAGALGIAEGDKVSWPH